jgi:hypothetical protein
MQDNSKTTMTDHSKILNRVRSLEAYFNQGLEEATKLRKMLEGDSSSSSTRKGLSDDYKAKLQVRRKKVLLKSV